MREPQGALGAAQYLHEIGRHRRTAELLDISPENVRGPERRALRRLGELASPLELRLAA